MAVLEMKPGIHYVGVQDWDREIFDALIPLPDGTSYNAYVVIGSEKTLLIDSAEPEKREKYFQNLDELGLDRVDYIIAHHAEQDHSGSIPFLLERYPEAQVVTNEKCKVFLMDLLLIPENRFIVIGDGDTLSLGDKTLEFILAPWVHWPETMFTYLREDKVLFTCDFLGSHTATADLFVTDEARIYEAAKRYYAEIMMPFRPLVKRHLKRIREMEVDMIGPSHGPVYDNPGFILDAYDEWVKDESENLVLIPYVSMHGSTEKMVDYLVDRLIERGISVIPFNLTYADLGKIAINLVDAATVVIAAPMVLAGPHPTALHATAIVNSLRPKLKYAGIIGSYGWGGKLVETLGGLLGNLQAEFLEPVLVKGYPKKEDFEKLDELADDILRKHQESDLIITE
jgi:flavorubredoxin